MLKTKIFDSNKEISRQNRHYLINLVFLPICKSYILNKLIKCEQTLIYILNDRSKRSTTGVYGRFCNLLKYNVVMQKQKAYQKIYEKL